MYQVQHGDPSVRVWNGREVAAYRVCVLDDGWPSLERCGLLDISRRWGCGRRPRLTTGIRLDAAEYRPVTGLYRGEQQI